MVCESVRLNALATTTTNEFCLDTRDFYVPSRDMASDIASLPDDLQHRIMLHLDGIGLSSAACSCVLWKAVAQSAAEVLVMALLPPVPRTIPPAPFLPTPTLLRC